MRSRDGRVNGRFPPPRETRHRMRVTNLSTRFSWQVKLEWRLLNPQSLSLALACQKTWLTEFSHFALPFLHSNLSHERAVLLFLCPFCWPTLACICFWKNTKIKTIWPLLEKIWT
uniref:Uncharacterized protein n=1 Tax=Meloidogyne enterolobii TaxID=390850 RepID=A0A6V7V3Z5_MELEN|nr:unnamed protein product [Meloidogyne enterolobii]